MNREVGAEIVYRYRERISGFIGYGEVRQRLLSELELVLRELKTPLGNPLLAQPIDYDSFSDGTPQHMITRIRNSLYKIETYYDLLALVNSGRVHQGFGVRSLGKKYAEIVIQHLKDKGLYQ